MTIRTIARTATRKIAAIRETFTEAVRYDSDRGERVPCEPAAAWEALDRTRSARLLVNAAGDVHTVRVHSSLWYELREPDPQTVADRQAAAEAEADRVAWLRMAVFGDTSPAAAQAVASIQQNADDTEAETGARFSDAAQWEQIRDHMQHTADEDTSAGDLSAAYAAVRQLGNGDLDAYNHNQASARDLLARSTAAAPGPAADDEQPADDPAEEPLPAEVLAARPGDVVVTRDTLHALPQYDVWIGREHVGVIWDETGARLDRPPFAVWSGKLAKNRFFATLDAAADAITAANLPAGPLGLTAPTGPDAAGFRILPVRRRARVLARAAEICGTGRAHARAFRTALQEDRTEHLASVLIPDEETFGHCRALSGGEIHTAAPDSPTVYPLCRTMGQDNRGTQYVAVPAAAPTCRHCIGYRERRAEHRARQAA